MRVTFGAMHRNALSGLETATERLLEFQAQVATGKRVNKPSDDPSATLGGIAERNEIAALDRYTHAADSATSRLSVVDTVLSDIVSKLTDAKVAALSARGSTVTDAQRQAAAQQLEGLRDALFENFNASFRGEFLFSGASAAAPYGRNPDRSVTAYQGSSLQIEVDVDRSRAVKVGFDGETIARGTDTADVFTVLQDLIDAARTGNSDGLGAGMIALDRAFERATTAQARVGADMALVDDQKLRLGEMKRASGARLAALENADMAAAISGMTHAEAAYEAALGAAGAVTRKSLMDYLS